MLPLDLFDPRDRTSMARFPCPTLDLRLRCRDLSLPQHSVVPDSWVPRKCSSLCLSLLLAKGGKWHLNLVTVKYSSKITTLRALRSGQRTLRLR